MVWYTNIAAGSLFWNNNMAAMMPCAYTLLNKFIFYDNSTNSRLLIGLFLSSISRQRHTFIIYAMRQRARADNLTVCYRKKQMDVSFSCVCPVIFNEFLHNIVKVVCVSTWLSPCGSTATLTMLWCNSWSITGQTHEKLTSIC